MSLEAALRFEADRPSNPNLKKAYQAQVERIKYDEVMADRDNVMRLHKFNDFWDTLVQDLEVIEQKAKEEQFETGKKSEKGVNQRAEWNENLEEASWKKRIKADHEIIKAEMRMVAKAALAVRRVALKKLLEKELEMWEKELSLQGKTFYKQRI